MRAVEQTEYIVQCIRDAGSTYEDDARAFLAEHDAQVRADALAEGAALLTAATDRPAPEEANFYQPGHEYTYPRYADGHDWKFRVDTITTHPDGGERTALGWRHWQGQWEPYAYGEDAWDVHNCDPAGALISTPSEVTR